jgi:hypothetical protein
MDWFCVRIPGRRSAAAWMELAREVHRDAGFPHGCRVHHEISVKGEHFLYFSPECAEVFPKLLKLFGASTCARPYGIDALMQVLKWPRPTLQMSRAFGVGDSGAGPSIPAP